MIFSSHLIQGKTWSDRLCLSRCKGILAWLDVRDSDLYKFDDSTKMPFLLSKEMLRTSVQMRLEAPERIHQD